MIYIDSEAIVYIDSEAIGVNPYRALALGPYELSLSELETMQTLADWSFNKAESCSLLNISLSTLNTHIGNIFQKTHTHSVAEAYALGVREGFWK